MIKLPIFIIVAILASATFPAAQPLTNGKSDHSWLILPIDEMHETAAAVPTPTPRHEWDWLAFASYRFYKKNISSQDAISCTFEPSCSTYGLHAIRNLGVLAGLGATFDRLSRCHGWNRGAYKVDVSSGLNLDPIQLIHP
jgi:hypothetical protein